MGFIARTSVGIGSTDTAGRNAGIGTETGTIILNSSIPQVQIWDGSSWQRIANFVSSVSATGGTKTTSGNNTLHTFNTSGEFLVSEVPTGSNAPKALATVLVIGGGGGGQGSQGFEGGGGGGGGGMVEGSNYPIAAQPYSIVVGGGGAFQSASGTPSTAFGATGVGGGYGNGSQGGSGGGGGGSCCAPPVAGGTSVQSSQPLPGTGSWAQYGNNGGAGINQGGGGGGGGAGGAGNNGPGGAGGGGRANSITGSPVTYARGGGGGYRTPGSPGNCNPNGGNIYQDNRGNGGNVCNAGSPGVVIISYPT